MPRKSPTHPAPVFVSGPNEWEQIGPLTWVFRPFIRPEQTLRRPELEALKIGTPLWVMWPFENSPHLQVLMGWVVRRSKKSGRPGSKDPVFISWWEFCYENRRLVRHGLYSRYKMGREWERYYINRAECLSRKDDSTHLRTWPPHPLEMEEIESRSRPPSGSSRVQNFPQPAHTTRPGGGRDARKTEGSRLVQSDSTS